MLLVPDYRVGEEVIIPLEIDFKDWKGLVFDIESYLKNVCDDNSSGVLMDMGYIERVIQEFKLNLAHKYYRTTIKLDFEESASRMLENAKDIYGDHCYLCKQNDAEHILKIVIEAFSVDI